MRLSHLRVLGSVLLGALLLVSSAALADGGQPETCSSSEESACTNTFTDCTNKAAAAADKAACQKCVDNYCSCYDSCGNTCDRDKKSATCAGLP